MSSQKTEHYELNQWLATDQVLRTDFNADNAKIDGALNTLAGQVAGKADGEAFQALSGTVAEHTAAIAQLGNCQIYTASYTGNGSDSRTHTFPGPPAAIFISGLHYQMFGLRGDNQALANDWGTQHYISASWSGNYLTLSDGGHSDYIGNQSGTTYYVVAFIDAAA